MKLTLARNASANGRTIGRLLTEGGDFICYTLEDVIREVSGRPVSEWKVHGKTAIPMGEYRITLENSPRFGPNTLTVRDVPGFVGVRIHAGNTSADTEGCPLLGMRVNENGIVGGTSRPAVALVREMVRKAIAAGETVLMRITQP